MPRKPEPALAGVLSGTTRYAPPEGTDEAFDDMHTKVVEALEASKNPEDITPEAAREMLARRLTEFGNKSWDTITVDEPIEEDVIDEVVTDLAVPRPVTDRYWYEKPGDARMIDHFFLTRRALGNEFHGGLLITGPAGVGKTTGVGVAVERLNRTHGLGLQLLTMNCATITDTSKWLGRREVDATGTHYHESDFIRGVREGYAILLDDFSRLHATILNLIMPLLDGAQALHLSDLNITVPVNPNTTFLATANIGAQFGGTYRMDWAHRERFPYTIEKGFPPADEEIRILTSHTNVDADGASILVDIANKTREFWESGDLRAPISTRVLVNAAVLVESGMSEREALSFTALPLYDGNSDGQVGEKSERAQVMAAIDGRIGRRR